MGVCRYAETFRITGMFFFESMILFSTNGSMRYLELVRYNGFPLEGFGIISKLEIDLFDE
jgi:hypothetical protein